MELIEYASKLAESGLLPQEFRKNPANIIYAAEIARDLGISPVTAMRGIYVLNGRVGFYSHFMLAMANKANVFESPVGYQVDGSGDDLEVTCSAVLRGGVMAEETITMRMAIAEGWTRNPKYKTLPVQMLKKRALRMLIDNYCPEVMSGMGAADVEDFDEQPTVIKTVTRSEGPIPITRGNPAIRAMLDRVKNDPSLANAEAIVAEIEQNEIAEVTPPAPRQLDLTSNDDRALVSAAVKRLVKAPGWIGQHRDKLGEYLKAKNVPADPQAVEESICEYLQTVGDGQ
jgi:hypothetical protein